MAYNTLNPLGSKDPRDLYDNATNFDNYANGPDPMYANRFGQQKLSIEGMNQAFNSAQTGRATQFNADQVSRSAQFAATLAAIGFIWMGDYGAGITLTSRQQYVVRDGIAYIVANSTTLPYTTTGNWATEVSKFKALSDDQLLRSDLADPTQGASIVANSIQVVSNMVKLKALPTTGVTRYAETMGFYAPGDGGGSQYFVPTDPTGLVPNGWSVVTADDGGLWCLNHNNVIDIRQAGARHNTDCTAAIQQSIDVVSASASLNRGGKVLIPGFFANFSGTILISAPFITIEGLSKGALLRSMTPTSDAIRTTNNYTTITNLEITYAVGSSTATAIDILGGNFTCRDVTVSGPGIGAYLHTGACQVFDNVKMLDCAINGWLMRCDDLSSLINDVIIVNWYALTTRPENFSLGHFRCVGRVEGLMLGKGDGIGGHASFTTDAVGTNGLRYSTFEGCYFDSTTLGANFSEAHHNVFSNVWASGGRGGSRPGISFDACTHFTLTNTMTFNCGAAGIGISGCNNFSLIGNDASNNSQDLDGLSAGISIVNSSKFTCMGNGGNGAFQIYGELIDNCSDFTVTGERFGVNKNGSVIIGSGCTNFEATGNRGYVTRKQGSAVLPASATSVVVTHGLSRTPLASGIRVQTNGATATGLFVSSANATTFTVGTQTANGGSSAFTWEADASIAP